MEHRKGLCPRCDSSNLNYETNVNKGEQLYYPFVCNDCGFIGKEWYKLYYIETTE